jgi:hypothetical protein
LIEHGKTLTEMPLHRFQPNNTKALLSPDKRAFRFFRENYFTSAVSLLFGVEASVI